MNHRAFVVARLEISSFLVRHRPSARSPLFSYLLGGPTLPGRRRIAPLTEIYVRQSNQKNDIINFDSDVRLGVGIESFSRTRLDRFAVFESRTSGDESIYQIFRRPPCLHTLAFSGCRRIVCIAHLVRPGRKFGTQSVFHKQKMRKASGGWNEKSRCSLLVARYPSVRRLCA